MKNRKYHITIPQVDQSPGSIALTLCRPNKGYARYGKVLFNLFLNPEVEPCKTCARYYKELNIDRWEKEWDRYDCINWRDYKSKMII